MMKFKLLLDIDGVLMLPSGPSFYAASFVSWANSSFALWWLTAHPPKGIMPGHGCDWMSRLCGIEERPHLGYRYGRIAYCNKRDVLPEDGNFIWVDDCIYPLDRQKAQSLGGLVYPVDGTIGITPQDAITISQLVLEKYPKYRFADCNHVNNDWRLVIEWQHFRAQAFKGILDERTNGKSVDSENVNSELSDCFPMLAKGNRK